MMAMAMTDSYEEGRCEPDKHGAAPSVEREDVIGVTGHCLGIVIVIIMMIINTIHHHYDDHQHCPSSL